VRVRVAVGRGVRVAVAVPVAVSEAVTDGVVVDDGVEVSVLVGTGVLDGRAVRTGPWVRYASVLYNAGRGASATCHGPPRVTTMAARITRPARESRMSQAPARARRRGGFAAGTPGLYARRP
jgi:hypothetical protein